MMVSERADGDVCGVERWAQVHQWIIGQKCFGDCYQVSVLGKRSNRQIHTAMVLGVGVLRGLVDRDDVGPGGSTEAS